MGKPVFLAQNVLSMYEQEKDPMVDHQASLGGMMKMEL